MRIGAGFQALFVFSFFTLLTFFPIQSFGQGPQILEKFEEYDVLRYELEVQFSTEKSRIAGTQKIEFKPLASIRSIWLDMGPELKVHKINWEGKSLGFEYLGEVLRINFPEMLRAEKPQLIEIIYYGNLQGIGAYPVWQKNDKDQIRIGLDASHLPAYFWWPCKEHGEDKANFMDLRVIIPEEVSLFSSGNQKGKIMRPGNFVSHQLKYPYPISPEDVSLYIGNFLTLRDAFEKDGQKVPLTYFIQAEKQDQAYAHLAQVKQVLKTLSVPFGPLPNPEIGYTWFQPLEGASIDKQFKWGFDPVLVRDIANQWVSFLPKSSDSLGRQIQMSFPYYAEYLLVGKWFNQGNAHKYLEESSDLYHKKAAFLDAMRDKSPQEDIWFKNLIGFLQQDGEGLDAASYFEQKLGPDAASQLKQLFELEKKPVLTYYFSGKKRKLKLNYCWKNVPAGFEFPVVLKVEDENQIIIPASEWKSLTFKGVPQKYIYPEPAKAWFEVKEETFAE